MSLLSKLFRGRCTSGTKHKEQSFESIGDIERATQEDQDNGFVVYGEGLLQAQQNQPALFQINSPEVDLIRCLVKVLDSSGKEQPVTFECCTQCVYKASYQPVSKGKHMIEVKWREKHVTGSPFVVDVK